MHSGIPDVYFEELKHVKEYTAVYPIYETHPSCLPHELQFCNCSWFLASSKAQTCLCCLERLPVIAILVDGIYDGGFGVDWKAKVGKGLTCGGKQGT